MKLCKYCGKLTSRDCKDIIKNIKKNGYKSSYILELKPTIKKLNKGGVR